MSIRAQQDYEFAKALYDDTVKNYQEYLNKINRDRETQRSAIQKLLATKIPALEQYLTPEQQKLLRIPVRFRTPEDNLAIQQIQEELSKIEQACVNVIPKDKTKVSNKIYHFKIPGTERIFCVDLDTIVNLGYFNTELGLVNFPIVLPETKEKFMYPLNKEDSESVMGALYTNYPHLDLERYEKLYPEVRGFLSDISNLKAELNKFRL